MVLFSLAAVGWAANAEGGAGGPLAVLIIAIVAAECGKAVSKEDKDRHSGDAASDDPDRCGARKVDRAAHRDGRLGLRHRH